MKNELCVNAVVEKIGPIQASLYLETNESNRAINKRILNMYAKEIMEGNWKLNGQPIIFGKSGRLLDGQHRLLAILDAGEDVLCLVVRGVDDDTFDTLDAGKKRNAADILSIEKVENSRNVASAARLLVKYDSNSSMTNNDVVPNAEINRKYMSERERLDNAAKIAGSIGYLCMNSSVGFCYVLFDRIDHTACEYFFEKLSSGEGMNATNPILRLRETLIRRKGQEKSTKRSDEFAALIIKAWNAWRKGKIYSVISYKRGVEKFPIPE
jgi:hypothetical protein